MISSTLACFHALVKVRASLLMRCVILVAVGWKPAGEHEYKDTLDARWGEKRITADIEGRISA